MTIVHETLPAIPPETGSTVDAAFGGAETVALSLDDAAFDPIAYINTLFPNEQSLIQWGTIQHHIQGNMQRVQSEISHLISSHVEFDETALAHNTSTAESPASPTKDRLGKGESMVLHSKAFKEVHRAQQSIRQLYGRIQSIQQRSNEAQALVHEISHDIKQLDAAKRNITASIDLLTKYNTLKGLVGNMQHLMQGKEYAALASLLDTAAPITADLQAYKKVKPIFEVLLSMTTIKDALKRLILDDFADGFTAQGMLKASVDQLRHAANIAHHLDADFKDHLLQWYAGVLLKEYTSIFRTSDEVAALDNVARRFAWLKRLVNRFDEEQSRIWSQVPDWHVLERVCIAFASETFKDMQEQLRKANTNKTLDVKTLLTAMQLCLEFEQALGRRFGYIAVVLEHTVEEGAEAAKDANVRQGPNPFVGSVASAFDPFLNLWVESEHAVVSAYIAEFNERDRVKSFVSTLTDEEKQTGVFSVSADIFWYFSQLLPKIEKVGYGKALKDMSIMMVKSLEEFADALHQSMQKDVRKALTAESMQIACMCINTADYCAKLCSELETKVKANMVDANAVSLVQFNAVQEIYQSLIPATSQLISKRLEVALQPAFTAMTRVNWGTIQFVGDQSEYINAVETTLKAIVPTIKAALISTGHQRFLLDKVVKFVCEKYMECIYKCKPISEIGAEQMLLDTHALKTILVALPNAGHEGGEKVQVPASYIKAVQKLCAKAENLLKTILAPSVPPDAMIQSYLLVMDTHFAAAVEEHQASMTGGAVPKQASAEENEQKLIALKDGFIKVLELKGCRRAEVPPLIGALLEHVKVATPEMFGNLSGAQLARVNSTAYSGAALPLPPPGTSAPSPSSQLSGSSGHLAAGQAPRTTAAPTNRATGSQQVKSTFDSMGKVFSDMNTRWGTKRGDSQSSSATSTTNASPMLSPSTGGEQAGSSSLGRFFSKKQ